MMRLVLPPLALALAAALLFGADYWLSSSAARDRDMRDRIGRLIRQEDRARIDLAAVTVEIGERDKWTYARVDDRWRLLDATNAVADEEAIDRLGKALLDGEGVVHSTDPKRAAEYGFTVQNAIRVLLHGPKLREQKNRDVRFRCELGARIESIDGCYVKREGSNAVWAIDSDPRAIIEQSRKGSLPPLVEANLVSRTWTKGAGRLSEIRVERGGAPPLALKIETIEIDPEEMRKGKDPYRVTAQEGGTDVAVSTRAAMAYVSFLYSASGRRVLPREEAAARGIDVKGQRAAAKVTLLCDGKPCVLLIAHAPNADDSKDGSVAVWCAESGVLFEVDTGSASALLPDAAALATDESSARWQQLIAPPSMPGAGSIESPR